jgi:hypothetical protein
MFYARYRFVAVLAAALAGLGSQSPILLAQSAVTAPAVSIVDRSATPLRLIIERYGSDLEALGRFFPVEYSETRIARLRHFQEQTRHELEAVDFNSLDQDGKVDYLLLRNHVHHELSLLDQTAGRRKETEELLPFTTTLVPLIENRRRATPIEYEQAAKTLAETITKIGKTQEGLEERLKTSKDSKTNLPTAWNPWGSRRMSCAAVSKKPSICSALHICAIAR